MSTNEKHLDDATIVNDKRIVMPSYTTSNPTITAPPTDNSTICSASSLSPHPQQQQQQQPIQNEYLPPAVEYYEKVEALHACTFKWIMIMIMIIIIIIIVVVEE